MVFNKGLAKRYNNLPSSPMSLWNGWLDLEHIDSTPKYKPILDTAHSAQVLFIHRHLSQLLEPHFPVRFTCLGEGRSKNSVCLHSPPSPIPMSTPMFPLLNLATGLPRFSLRGCSNFAGQKLLPCVITFLLPLYLSTNKWNFLGAFFLDDTKKASTPWCWISTIRLV